jgi:repressor LexA
MLTKKQKNLLIFINEKLKRTGISPSYDEMRVSLNLKSKSGIHRLISALEERGFIKRLPHKARALEVIKLPENAGAQDLYNNFSPKIIKGGLDLNKIDDEEIFVPVLGKIAAGSPIEALENQSESLPLSKNFLGSNEYFALKVEGDSMINAGINTGDYVIIKKTDIAESGKIVVALIDDHEATLKRMRKKGPSTALESANPAYETKIYNTERVKIQGVLTSLYRKF